MAELSVRSASPTIAPEYQQDLIALPEGRALWPSLCISAAALLALAASLLSAEVYRWASVATLAIAAAPWRPLPQHSITIVLAGLCGWMLANALFISPAYAADGLYRPLLLFAAFAAVVAQERKHHVLFFRIGVLVLALLVGLGMSQHFLGVLRLDANLVRAAATFVTPNTFAAAINLFLLPLIALYLVTARSARVLILVLWLFAGLVASQSRGGMLSLLVGLGYIAICFGWIKPRADLRKFAKLLVGLVAVWLAMGLIAQATLPGDEVPGRESGHGQSIASRWAAHGGGAELMPSLYSWAGRATWDRAEIYTTTWNLIREQPFSGAGANMFWPIFESRRSENFGDWIIRFAHNDYLQTWLEFGAMGLILLLTLAAMSLWSVRVAVRRAPNDPMPLACGAALASCFAHAIVDFPLYVPFHVLIVGAALGVLVCSIASPGRAMPTPDGHFRARAAIVGVGLVLAATPVMAQFAAGHALAQLTRGDASGGLYWQAWARRLEPRNHSHYWAEAVIWRELGAELGNRSYFAKADQLLVDGIAANAPLASTLVLERARLHRRYGAMLDNGAKPAEIVDWMKRALDLEPYWNAGEVELARALIHAGRKEEARAAERRLSRRRPDWPALPVLREELK